MPSPSDVWTAALTYEGAPWKHQGRRKDGIDCLGLIICVAVDLGIDGAERFLGFSARNYAMLPPNVLAAELIKAGCIRMSAPALGMIGLFAQAGTHPIHVGIFGDGEMVHALRAFERKQPGKVVVHGYAAPWPSRLRGVFAYPGVDYQSASQ